MDDWEAMGRRIAQEMDAKLREVGGGVEFVTVEGHVLHIRAMLPEAVASIVLDGDGTKGE